MCGVSAAGRRALTADALVEFIESRIRRIAPHGRAGPLLALAL